MARYKDYTCDQIKMVRVSYERQILPNSFEYSLLYLIDPELDLSTFDSHSCNDGNFHHAYDPRLSAKIIDLAYSKGISSGRLIERSHQENITFTALSADSQSHFSTLADFVFRSLQAIADVFGQVVLMCNQPGLIGKQLLATDGCKLPSNNSKEWNS
ncbi:MAG: transposase [Chromatiales bacterium]|jgi:transposase